MRTAPQGHAAAETQPGGASVRHKFLPNPKPRHCPCPSWGSRKPSQCLRAAAGKTRNFRSVLVNFTRHHGRAEGLPGSWVCPCPCFWKRLARESVGHPPPWGHQAVCRGSEQNRKAEEGDSAICLGALVLSSVLGHGARGLGFRGGLGCAPSLPRAPAFGSGPELTPPAALGLHPGNGGLQPQNRWPAASLGSPD